ncbi:GyrI-like domain-containing protein [Flavobacterium sp.]|uniref:GyrI-like domain-containing protein n=1 Tax=Flavobacterium sp. TaxID=239 RepID=UPI004034439B
MTPRIRSLKPKKLIGKHLTMSHAHNRTFELWSSFMPHRKEIVNAIGTDLFSLQICPEGFYVNFDPANEFEKWAAVEVAGVDVIPDGMKFLELPEGLYAVFVYKGSPENADSFFNYIFCQWLPASGYVLDNRPHFELLGEKYRHGDPASEEEVWIPIK